jgi:hypothetical protein
MTTRRLILALAVLGSSVGCLGGAPGDRQYTANDLVLVTAYTAKDTCSCLFVMNQTQEFCNAYTKADPQVTNWTADMKAKTVESSALLFWGAKAHYVNDHLGCVLE